MTKRRIAVFLLLLLLFIFFIRSYPCILTTVSGWTGERSQHIEFHSLYHIARYGFEWRPIIKDASEFHYCNPLFLLFYFFYGLILFLITPLIFYLSEIGFFKPTKFKIIFSLLFIFPSASIVFSDNPTSKIAQALSFILGLPIVIANFLFTEIIELPTIVNYPLPAHAGGAHFVVISGIGIPDLLFMIILFATGLIFCYLLSCVITFSRNKFIKLNPDRGR